MPTATRLFAALLCVSGSVAASQMPGIDGSSRHGFIGPDGEMQYLPTLEEMEAHAARDTDYAPFAEYAQRRLEHAAMVTEIVYVDDDAPVGGDGTSWHTAHQSLQDALAADYSDRFVEIRMAQGLYRADRFNGVNTMDREASFSPRYEDTDNPTGIFRITGGFAGLGAKDPDQRDPGKFPTVITGDLHGDDGPDFTNYDDNTLVLFDNFNSELHGLVMEHALQAMVGNGSLTIDGCLVQTNAGTENRGASTFSGNITIVKRCIFYNNRSGAFGGAIAMHSTNAALVSNRFLSNEAVYQGGAVFSTPSSSRFMVLQNNYFAGNAVRGDTGSVGGAAVIYTRSISACNTLAFNRSEDGDGGGYGRASWFLADHFTIFDIYHMNSGLSGHGVHEQFPSLPMSRELNSSNPPMHHIRGSFVQDWESSESNRPGSYASALESIRDNSGEEVLFVDLAGPDGIIGTLDDDPTPRPDSPNIDRVVDLEGAEIALLDFADLNENGTVHEPLPFDLLGNPRSINTPGVGDPDGGIDAGAIEYTGDPNRFDYAQPISARRTDPMDDCEGDEPIRLYVNASGLASGDGSSWDSPLLELTEALDIARSRCGPVEIWLAAGTYLPDFSVPEWRASFRPTSNVTILGGFAGWEEVSAQRDPEMNPTVLSGDRVGNDDPADPTSILDNAYRVVVVAGERGGGVIDGVTIRGGHARARNYAELFSLLQGCVYGIGPYSRGGAVSVMNGEMSLVDCTVSACSAYFGAACSVSGSGVLQASGLRVLDDQLGTGCPIIRSQLDASGFDSIIAPAARLSITDSVLRVTDTTTPFGLGEFVNGELEITRSDIDVATRFLSGGGGYAIGSGKIYTRKFAAESSLLRRLRQVNSAQTAISNCTLLGDNFVRFHPAVRAPAQESLVLNNSIVTHAAFAYESLTPVSVAIHCIYFNTNFQTRIEEIRVATYEISKLFVDYAGPSGNPQIPDGDYRLAPGSRAINTGSNALVASEFDLDGNPRIIGSVVDRGAYEFTGTCTGDVNGDGVIDLADLTIVLSNFGQNVPFGDANGDGVVDLVDLNIVLAAFGQPCSKP